MRSDANKKDPAMNNLIEGVGLVKQYDGFTLDHVSIGVPEGHVVGLVGSNGSGKTTMIKALLGLIRPDEGEVRVFGAAPSGAAWKNRVGVVFDTCSFVPTMRVSDVAKIGEAAYENWDESAFAQMVDAFGIAMNKQVKDLSRGMGMKLSLAFALAHHPDLLILDEPTAGLDPLARDEALDLLRAFMEEEGRGILMSSHITTDLEKIADYIVCIDEGWLVFAEAKDDICGKAGVARCNEEQLADVISSGLIAKGGVRYLRRDFHIDVLVPDRFAFAQDFPGIVCDPASLDDYLLLMLKGGAR